MRGILSLLSALTDLSSAIVGLAATCREADGQLRQRLQLDAPADVIESEATPSLPTPAPKRKAARS